MEPNSHSQSLTCSISDITDENDVDINARMQMLSIVSGEDNPDGIAYAAAAGDVATMVKHLEKFPGEVGAHVPYLLEIVHFLTNSLGFAVFTPVVGLYTVGSQNILGPEGVPIALLNNTSCIEVDYFFSVH